MLTRLSTEHNVQRAEGDDPSPLVLEHVTWLYLLQASLQVHAQVEEGALLAIHAAANDLHRTFAQLQVFGRAIAARDPEGDLAAHARRVGLVTRFPGFRREERADIRALFERFGSVLQSALRFSVEDALAIEDVLFRRVTERIMSSIGEKRLPFSSDTFVFTKQDVADLTGVDPHAVAAFLGHFALGAGQLNPGKDHLPTLLEPLELRPLMDLGEERFLCHMIDKLVWAMRPTFEKVLADEHWANYDKHRAETVETATITALRRLGGDGWVNLRYQVPGDATTVYELDALWTLARRSVLGECKAGSFSLAARRGAPKSLKAEIRQLVVEADVQLDRADSQLLDRSSGGFSCDGQRVHPETYSSFGIIVTLDALPFSTVESQLHTFGALKRLGWSSRQPPRPSMHRGDPALAQSVPRLPIASRGAPPTSDPHER